MGSKEARLSPAARRSSLQLLDPVGSVLCPVLGCLCFSAYPCALMPGEIVFFFLSVNLLKNLKPLRGLSVHVDCLFWEFCFNVLAISPPPHTHTHMIAIFPSFLYLFSHP